MKPPTTVHNIETAIVEDVRQVLDRYYGRPMLRGKAATEIRHVLSKYREAGVPVKFFRILRSLTTGKHYVRVEVGP